MSSLFPQPNLYTTLFTEVIAIFDSANTDALIHLSLDTITCLANESIILETPASVEHSPHIHRQSLESLIMRLFDWLRLPEMTRSEFAKATCDSISITLKAIHVLQRVIYVLVYNSMNDRNLSLILRNTLVGVGGGNKGRRKTTS